MNIINNKFNNFFTFIQFCKSNKFQPIPEVCDEFSNEANLFKKGGRIKIKDEAKGSFTKYCGGNVTSKCIAQGKNSINPKIRKKATFADNARKWKHYNGGTLISYITDKLNDNLNMFKSNV